MKSILSVSLAATILLYAFHATADSIPGLSTRQTVVYPALMGCYNSPGSLINHGPDIYQTKGYCLHSVCGPLGTSVEATSNGTDCWCGNSLPPASAKVDTTYCNVNCAGYGALEQCGGNGYFSVYETGIGTVENSGSDSSASSSSISSTVPQITSTPTMSTTPSVVTVGGQTIVVTASSSVTPTATPASSKPGPNKAAIAAGVVVGFVAVGAAVGGIFLFLRHRRNRQVEEEYRRNAAVSSFISGGKPPTSGSGASSFDTRLDPSVAQRRMSDGSIADNQDYSRRILKVTNA